MPNGATRPEPPIRNALQELAEAVTAESSALAGGGPEERWIEAPGASNPELLSAPSECT